MAYQRKFILAALGAAVMVCAQASGQQLSLEQVISEVCTNSDSVKMMKETVKKSEQMVRENWANALPYISATGAYVHNYGSPFSSSGSSSSGSSRPLAKEASTFTPMDSAMVSALESVAPLLKSFSSLSNPVHSNIYMAGISFNQPIYTFGKVGQAIHVAKTYNQSAQYNYQRNMQTLQLGALDVFFGALTYQKKAEIAAHSLDRKKELNSFLERNFRNGSGSKAQVLKTRADVADQVAQIIVARRDAKVARMNLNMMMGRALTDSTAVDTVSMLDKVVAMNIPQPEDAAKTALTNRADIKSLRLLAESTKGGAKIYRAMYLPTIGATGSAGYTRMNSDLSLLSNNGSPSWSLGVGAQWTLFDGFANSAKAAQYMSDANKLEIVASTMEKMVEIEVRSAILECAAADSNLNSSKEMLSAAQETYDLTNSNFKQGSGQFSDLQLADETFQQAELGMINAKYRQTRSRAALQVAMGCDIIKIK
ncbi:MAG TPA: TolC family protein [Chitinivibrionales bacterium]|nr:TolC family protein [Chitinivibrionales bacterium]